MYSIWNTTSDIPATHVQSFNLAVKQMDSWMPKLEEAEEKLKALEKSLTANGAPYTPGRR